MTPMDWIPALDDQAGLGRPVEMDTISLTEEELSEAASHAGVGHDSEENWTRYLRTLALLALRRWIKQRKAQVVIGPEINPEEPDRVLMINGRATQLVCASGLADEAEISLAQWRNNATAPQLLLLALVDEEHAVVSFPGVLNSKGLIAAVKNIGAAKAKTVNLRLEYFSGGLERLLRWVALLREEALPQRSLAEQSEKIVIQLRARIKKWLDETSVELSKPHTGFFFHTYATFGIAAARGSNKSADVLLLRPNLSFTLPGFAMAEAICPRPCLWADRPLAEVQIWHETQLLWRQQATSKTPIEGPIAWPLSPLMGDDRLTIRLRPWGSPIGSESEVKLVALPAAELEENEMIITAVTQGISEAPDQPVDAEAAIYGEAIARLQIADAFR